MAWETFVDRMPVCAAVCRKENSVAAGRLKPSNSDSKIVVPDLDEPGKTAATKVKAAAKPGRRQKTAAEKKAISEKLKAAWARRKAGKAS